MPLCPAKENDTRVQYSPLTSHQKNHSRVTSKPSQRPAPYDLKKWGGGALKKRPLLALLRRRRLMHLSATRLLALLRNTGLVHLSCAAEGALGRRGDGWLHARDLRGDGVGGGVLLVGVGLHVGLLRGLLDVFSLVLLRLLLLLGHGAGLVGLAAGAGDVLARGVAVFLDGHGVDDEGGNEEEAAGFVSVSSIVCNRVLDGGLGNASSREC